MQQSSSQKINIKQQFNSTMASGPNFVKTAGSGFSKFRKRPAMPHLDEVISQESAEIESLLEEGLLGNRGGNGVSEKKLMSWGEKQDEKRRSMQELFRIRLKNNKGKDKLSQVSQSLNKRKNWNYIVGYDGNDPYCPPTHIPLMKKKP